MSREKGCFPLSCRISAPRTGQSNARGAPLLSHSGSGGSFASLAVALRSKSGGEESSDEPRDDACYNTAIQVYVAQRATHQAPAGSGLSFDQCRWSRVYVAQLTISRSGLSLDKRRRSRAHPEMNLSSLADAWPGSLCPEVKMQVASSTRGRATHACDHASQLISAVGLRSLRLAVR